MPGMATGQRTAKSPPRQRTGRALRGGNLLRDLVGALSYVALGGFDLDPLLLGGGGDEPADAVGLPPGGLHDFGEGGAFGASDHLQDLRALALGARDAGVAFGLAGFLAGLGFLLR